MSTRKQESCYTKAMNKYIQKHVLSSSVFKKISCCWNRKHQNSKLKRVKKNICTNKTGHHKSHYNIRAFTPSLADARQQGVVARLLWQKGNSNLNNHLVEQTYCRRASEHTTCRTRKHKTTTGATPDIHEQETGYNVHGLTKIRQ